jgi:hypothetical protein
MLFRLHSLQVNLRQPTMSMCWTSQLCHNGLMMCPWWINYMLYSLFVSVSLARTISTECPWHIVPLVSLLSVFRMEWWCSTPLQSRAPSFPILWYVYVHLCIHSHVRITQLNHIHHHGSWFFSSRITICPLEQHLRFRVSQIFMDLERGSMTHIS